MIPVSPPATNMKMKPAMKSSGVLKRALPVMKVMHQAKTWIVLGITTIAGRRGEEDDGHRRHPGREHVVRPDAEADEDDEQLGDRHERERDDPPLREGRDDLRRDPEGRDDEDVDLGVAEDPEQVLPEERRAALRDVEEVRADVAVEEEEDRVRRQRRQREQEPERRREEGEAEERHPVERHPGRPHLEDRHDEVRRGEASTRSR